MTTTADWLHLKLGRPLDVEPDAAAQAAADADVIARQREWASQPLSVVFEGR